MRFKTSILTKSCNHISERTKVSETAQSIREYSFRSFVHPQKFPCRAVHFRETPRIANFCHVRQLFVGDELVEKYFCADQLSCLL